MKKIFAGSVLLVVLLLVYIFFQQITAIFADGKIDYFYYHATLHDAQGHENGSSDIKINGDENKATLTVFETLPVNSNISIPVIEKTFYYHKGETYTFDVTMSQALKLRSGLWTVRTEKSSGIYEPDITPYQKLRLFDIDANGKVDLHDAVIVFENWATYNREKNKDYTPVTGWYNKLKNKSSYTLLASYYLSGEHPDYQHMSYMPRSRGNKEDVLHIPSSSAGNLVRLRFNRPALLALAYDNGQSITKKITTSEYAFTQTVPAVNTIYISEGNGTSPKEPLVPQGKETPLPNKPCPEWVHDQYQVKASDGNTYRTWHPQIDPVYWCYFGHEHGSNPVLFDEHFKVPFGYAGMHMGMNEKHEGFKVYVWNDILGYRWMVVQHQGTSSNQAACGREHELDFFTKNIKTDEIVSERYFVGDYGVSKMLGSGEALVPSKCVLQGKINSKGSRFLPVAGQSNNAEEPWIVNGTDVIGFNMADFSVDTLDSMRMCSDKTCDTITMTGKKGSDHMISFIDGLGTRDDEVHKGYFYTDPMGMKDLKKTDEMAVRQYTKPDFAIDTRLIRSIHTNLSTHCKDLEGFGAVMQCGIDLPDIPAERENSIHSPN